MHIGHQSVIAIPKSCPEAESYDSGHSTLIVMSLMRRSKSAANNSTPRYIEIVGAA